MKIKIKKTKIKKKKTKQQNSRIVYIKKNSKKIQKQKQVLSDDNIENNFRNRIDAKNNDFKKILKDKTNNDNYLSKTSKFSFNAQDKSSILRKNISLINFEKKKTPILKEKIQDSNKKIINTGYLFGKNKKQQSNNLEGNFNKSFTQEKAISNFKSPQKGQANQILFTKNKVLSSINNLNKMKEDFINLKKDSSNQVMVNDVFRQNIQSDIVDIYNQIFLLEKEKENDFTNNLTYIRYS